MLVTNLSEIKGDGILVELDATVISIKSEGNKEEKKPIIFLIKLESTGENIQVVSWNTSIINRVKSFLNTLEVVRFECSSSLYREQIQIRVQRIVEVLAEPSKQKKINLESSDSLEIQINDFVEKNITDPDCKEIMDMLVLKNPDYFKWPAARSVHHNYKGGLAKHSLGVARNVLHYLEDYGDLADKSIALTGAFIHDIGKLREYTADGEISFEGSFTTHLVSGCLMLQRSLAKWIKESGDEKIFQRRRHIEFVLSHIIQSHHEKLEFGSPVVPKCMEAVFVSMGDLVDSRMEALKTSYLNLNEGTFSEPQKVIEGCKIYKWNNTQL